MTVRKWLNMDPQRPNTRGRKYLLGDVQVHIIKCIDSFWGDIVADGDKNDDRALAQIKPDMCDMKDLRIVGTANFT
jgi:hypothetical protein